LPRLKIFSKCEIGLIDAKFLVFSRWWAESDMDTEGLAKVSLDAIDDWPDEEIVGFESEGG
jgi:hypothetical protein